MVLLLIKQPVPQTSEAAKPESVRAAKVEASPSLCSAPQPEQQLLPRPLGGVTAEARGGSARPLSDGARAEAEQRVHGVAGDGREVEPRPGAVPALAAVAEVGVRQLVRRRGVCVEPWRRQLDAGRPRPGGTRHRASPVRARGGNLKLVYLLNCEI